MKRCTSENALYLEEKYSVQGAPSLLDPKERGKETYTEIRLRAFSLEGETLRGNEYKMSFLNEKKEGEFSENILNIKKLSFENRTLKNALRNLRKMFCLSDEYAAHLEEALPQENYEEIEESLHTLSLSYARRPRSLAAEDIAREAKVILETLDEEMGSDELGDILNLGVVDVDNALTEYCSSEESRGVS